MTWWEWLLAAFTVSFFVALCLWWDWIVAFMLTWMIVDRYPTIEEARADVLKREQEMRQKERQATITSVEDYLQSKRQT